MPQVLSTWLRCSLWAALGAASAPTAAAQTTFLVADIHARHLSPPSYPAGFVRAGSLVFFAAETLQHGRELHATQGLHENPSTTALVLDIWPGIGGSSPEHLTAVGSLLFFTAEDGTRGRELWVSDGTAAGTRLVRDLRANGSSAPDHLLAHAGALFFAADDGVHGRELWRSDGTASGTAMVRDLRTGSASSNPAHLASASSGLYFAAEDAGSGRELWTSDGTSAGTRRVADLVPGAGSSNPSLLVALGSRVVFNAYDPVHGTEAWSSDGTAAGTARLGDLTPGSGGSLIQAFYPASNAVYFFVYYSALWKTDGTAAGTALVSNNFAGTAYGAAALGSTLVFAVRNALQPGSSLWASDGTSGGTRFLRGGWTGYGLTELTTIGSNVWFQGSRTTTVNQGSLWKTDGTPTGTVEIATIHRSWPYLGGGPHGFAACANGRIAFSADDGDHGREPWVTDGSAAGTRMLRDLSTDLTRTHSAALREMTDVLGTIFFAAEDGTHGEELWKSDGTVFGTRLVLDIYPGRERSFLLGLTRAGDRAFFTAEDGVHGRELWVSDGTAAGTRLVVDLNPGPGSSNAEQLTALRGAIYYAAHDGQRSGLWRSDGTAAGTQPIAIDIRVTNLRAVGGKLYFAGEEPSRGSELWCSDGTPAGTFLVADIDPTIDARGPRSSSPREFVDFGGTVHFVATHTNHGYGDLWRTDGTPAGTQLVADLPFSGVAAPHSLTPVATQLFFVVTDLPSSMGSLWRSDGTSSGTRLVTARASDVRAPVPLGDRVLFSARASLQTELWISDGTDAGTSIVRDLHPTVGASPTYLTPIGTRRAIFAADDGASGVEAWITDGSPSGTLRVADLAWSPSSASSNPRLFTLSRGRVLFGADDGFLGDELWSHFPGATARRFGEGCAPSGEAPVLTGVDPVLGSLSPLDATSAPLGSVAFLLASTAPAAPIDFGGCSLYLDLATAFAAAAFPTTATQWTLLLQVPNGPHLLGQRVFAQVLYALPAAGFSLTNGVEYCFGM